MIPSLLTFKSHLDTVLVQSFMTDDLFSQTLRESFEWFINRRRDKPAEYIAKYLDNLLRKGDKGSNTLEQDMDRALVLSDSVLRRCPLTVRITAGGGPLRVITEGLRSTMKRLSDQFA